MYELSEDQRNYIKELGTGGGKRVMDVGHAFGLIDTQSLDVVEELTAIGLVAAEGPESENFVFLTDRGADLLRRWKRLMELLEPCFGTVDREFAGHSSEVDAAIKLLAELHNGNERLEELERAVQESLRRSTPQHITAQLGRVREMFGPWL